MTGLFVNHPATPSGLALVPGRSLLVCDRAGLRGTAGLLQPAVRGWVADAGGLMQPFWPAAPVIVAGPTVGASNINAANWKARAIGWSAPGATAFSLAAHVGSNPPVTIYTGAATSIEWDWFDTGSQFQPGALIVYNLTATNSVGSSVASTTAAAPTIPAPLAAPVASSITSSSMHLDWSTSQVYGANDYVVMEPSGIGKVVVGTATDMTSLIHDTTYHWSIRSRHQAAYVGAVRLDGPAGPTRVVATAAPTETGPANGQYRIEPTAATYQYGGGQSAGWRSTSDDYFHGDGASYGSDRGQQVTLFFYARPAAWAGGLGTKTVTRIQVYVLRQSGTGNSAGVLSRWGAHGYASRPAGAPTISGAYDAGSLAWSGGAWIDLPTSWGPALVAGTYRGVAWGKVAGRYMSAARNPSASTPNGTILVTIAN